MIRRGEKAIQLTTVQREAVKHDGERVARWLLSQVQSKLDRQGFASFHIPIDQTEPPWFCVGLEWLRRKPTEWEIVMFEQHGRREFRLYSLKERKVPACFQS